MNNGKPIHVLIVDDEERIRSTTTTLLKKRNFAVTAVATGKEAVSEIKRGEVDVAILDIKMPDMDGNEVLHEIKKIKPKNVQVIVLTGYGTPDSALAGLREGAFAYLTKPCDVDLLATKIRDAHKKNEQYRDREHRVRDIMVPLSSFGTVRENWSVAEAIEVILGHKTIITSTVEEEPVEVIVGNKTVITTTVEEGVHRSILVLDKASKVVGIVSFTDFLQGLETTYMRLLEDRPDVAGVTPEGDRDYSGIFTRMVRDLAKKPVRELMSLKPPTIDTNASLLEATNRLLALSVRRLLVMDGDKVVGVIREKDIMFEMANIIR
ncbi:MAG: response regulator [Candidatus Lindowbacteria bacterium]|nr:response regulator [Candidatus Lindowbacteria bacterium]